MFTLTYIWNNTYKASKKSEAIMDPSTKQLKDIYAVIPTSYIHVSTRIQKIFSIIWECPSFSLDEQLARIKYVITS